MERRKRMRTSARCKLKHMLASTNIFIYYFYGEPEQRNGKIVGQFECVNSPKSTNDYASFVQQQQNRYFLVSNQKSPERRHSFACVCIPIRIVFHRTQPPSTDDHPFVSWQRIFVETKRKYNIYSVDRWTRLRLPHRYHLYYYIPLK